MIQMLISWMNFIVLNLSGFFFAYFYIISVMPATREQKSGEKAWKECKNFRSISGLFEIIMILNIILWFWFPIPSLGWLISQNFLLRIIIAFAIFIPCGILLFNGLKDAGKESLKPSKETKPYKGIYNHIRHPQTLGEFPMFIAIAIIFNSWFLTLWFSIYILIVVVIIMHFEEKDLIKRFGDAYIKYRRETGAFFPKFWRKRSNKE